MSETMTQSAAEAFSAIYSEHSWKTEGAESLSGPGSDPVRTRAYRRLLEKLLRRHRVRSVVDLGCGDWASSRLVDWSGIDYLGLDVVPFAIEHCRTHYSRPGVRFEVCDLIQEEPPPADLLICKEVLQHLPNAGVHRALSFLGRYRLALLVNDLCATYRQPGWFKRPRTVSAAPNLEIKLGSYRPLHLTGEPFNLNARRVLRYWNHDGRPGWFKECLLWVNPTPHSR
jgi:SAM-dependent methyltransferase